MDNNISEIAGQKYTHFAEVRFKSDKASAVICEILWLLETVQGIRQEYIYNKFNITPNHLTKILDQAKGVWLTWQNGNGKRRHSFKQLKTPTQVALTYTHQEYLSAGSHLQAAFNSFIRVACNGNIPTAKRVGERLNVSHRKAQTLIAHHKKSYPQLRTNGFSDYAPTALDYAQVAPDYAQVALLISKPLVNTLSNHLVSKALAPDWVEIPFVKRVKDG